MKKNSTVVYTERNVFFFVPTIIIIPIAKICCLLYTGLFLQVYHVDKKSMC